MKWLILVLTGFLVLLKLAQDTSMFFADSAVHQLISTVGSYATGLWIVLIFVWIARYIRRSSAS